MPLLSSIKGYEDYMGSSPKAKDFEEYWENNIKKLKDDNLEYILLNKENVAKDVEIYDLYFKGKFSGKIHCRLFKPKNIKGKIPGVVFFHGYKSNNDSLYSKLPYVYNNMAVLTFDTPGQGGLSEDRVSVSGATLYGQIVKGVEDENKDNLFFTNVYLDAYKAIKILMSMDFIDEDRIGLTGMSQGGALSLVSAALNEKIKCIAPIYPYLCDFKKIFEMNLCENEYVEFKNYFRKKDPMHEREDAFFERLSYIDIQNFASKVKADVLWFMALLDKTCPPITQFSAYNKIKGNKQLKLYPEYGHEKLLYADDIIFEYFIENL